MSSAGAGPIVLHHYHLELLLPRGDRENLASALEGEPLALVASLPRERILEQIRKGRLDFRLTAEVPLEAFERDVATFSRYVYQIVRGIEVREEVMNPPDPDRVRAEKVLGRLGETARLPLLVRVQEAGLVIDPDVEDVALIAERWETYPRWVHDGMRRKHPRLRRL